MVACEPGKGKADGRAPKACFENLCMPPAWCLRLAGIGGGEVL
jgi:hypothetical protein